MARLVVRGGAGGACAQGFIRRRLLLDVRTLYKIFVEIYGKINCNQLPVHFTLSFTGARKHFQEPGTER